MTENYDGLIADAEKNDGKAREVLPVLRESQEHKEVQDTHRDLPSSRIDRDTNNPFIHRTNRHYIRLDTHKGDLLREIEISNRLIRAGKEHKKNCEEARRLRRMHDLQRALGQYDIKPLKMAATQVPSPDSLPPVLVPVANSLSRMTGLDALGICYALLGAVSIATWGRVTIKLNSHWSESAVNMLLQVSPSGTRKSALARELRMPFDQYCAKVNEGYEGRMQQARTERRLLDKAATKLAHKKIADALNKE